MESSSTVVHGNSSSRSRNVSVPVVSPIKDDAKNTPYMQVKMHTPLLNIDEYNKNESSFNTTPNTPSDRVGSHRGSTRVIIHESRQGSAQNKSLSSFRLDNKSDYPDGTCSSTKYCNQNPSDDDDDIWYTKWSQFCCYDGINFISSIKRK